MAAGVYPMGNPWCPDLERMASCRWIAPVDGESAGLIL